MDTYHFCCSKTLAVQFPFCFRQTPFHAGYLFSFSNPPDAFSYCQLPISTCSQHRLEMFYGRCLLSCLLGFAPADTGNLLRGSLVLVALLVVHLASAMVPASLLVLYCCPSFPVSVPTLPSPLCHTLGVGGACVRRTGITRLELWRLARAPTANCPKPDRNPASAQIAQPTPNCGRRRTTNHSCLDTHLA